MKTILLTTIILSIAIVVIAQKQPQWLMPLYFEDGNGDKDTIYIGYDPSTSSRGEDIDTMFDEGWIRIDATKFNVFLWVYPGLPGTDYYNIPLSNDTVRKTDIRSWYIGTNIGFVNGKMPVTLKWVDSLLYSDQLPYPDISPRPRARIDLYCDSGEPKYITCPIEYEPLSLTDYLAPEIRLPVTDSLVFIGSGSDYYIPCKAIGNMNIEIVPHNKQILNIEDSQSDVKVEIYPNPFTNQIEIKNLHNKKLALNMFNSAGDLIIKQTNSQQHIVLELGELPQGIYLLSVYTENKIFIKKMIRMN